MAVIKCKMCGGDLVLVPGRSVAECEYCGSMQTVPSADDEKKLTLFARAGRLRASCEFDKAAGIYEAIVADFPEEAEAYWGLVLCKYGIEYVDDPGTGKKIPTCHRSSFDSVMEDIDLEQALENADSSARRVYREEAKQIEQIRKGIIAVSSNEQPYDIFICYKETDENGNRTLDSVLAQDIYDALTEKKYRVFFSRISLEEKLGVEYEPYIFAALNSAKIMLAVGTDYEFYNAVWVKNEWSRFLKLMTKDKSKHLIPCFKGIDAYDMPREFARLQAQDLGKMGAIQDIIRGVEKLLPRDVKNRSEMVAEKKPADVSPTQPLLRRAFLFLEDGNWEKADEYCEKVLDMNPECAEAYLGKLLSELRVHRTEDLANCTSSFGDRDNYKKALRFADQALKINLEKSLASVDLLLETEKYCEIKNGVLQIYKGNQSHVRIPGSVRRIEQSAFAECKTITSLEIPESVYEIAQGAISGCQNLSHIHLSRNNPYFRLTGTCLIDKKKNTVLFGKRFQDLPADGSIRCIGERAFFGSSFLTEVRIPDGVSEIGENAFAECGNLQYVVLPQSVTSIAENALPHNPGIRILVSDDNPAFRMEGSCLIQVTEKTVIFGTNIQDLPTDGSVIKIGTGAFRHCALPENMVLPACVESIGNNAFSECKNLQSVTFFGKTLTMADNAFGSNTEGLTIYAFEDSDAARWAKKNRIATKENQEMKRITTANILERGNAALKDGEWKKASGLYEEVIKRDSINADAYICMALAREQCHTLDALVCKRVDGFRDVTPQTHCIKEKTDHINEMAERCSLPGFVEENEIRALYVFDRSYISEVAGRQKQYLEAAGWWQNHRQLSHAEKISEGAVAERLQHQKKQLLNRLSARVQMAREADARNIARLEKNYAEHIAQADQQAQKLYSDALALREQSYEQWQAQAKQDVDPEALNTLAGKFSKLGDYRESRELTEFCRKRAAEEQEKIEAEKKRRKAMAAEKKQAQRKRFAPILSAIAAVTAVCIVLSGPVGQLFTNRKEEPVQTAQLHETTVTETRPVETVPSQEELLYNQAAAWEAEGQLGPAAVAFGKVADYQDARARSLALWDKITDRQTVLSTHLEETVGVVGIRQDGTMRSAGSQTPGKPEPFDLSGWSDVVSVVGDGRCVVGLRSDGTVLTACREEDYPIAVSDWTDVVDIHYYAGSYYNNSVMDVLLIGLKLDGTIVVTGNSLMPDLSKWTDIVRLICCDGVIAGLKMDGTVVTAGSWRYNQQHVAGWDDIVELKAVGSNIVGRKADGTLVVTGGEFESQYQESDWTDIVDFEVASGRYMVGLKSDGTVISAGCGLRKGDLNVLQQWRDITDIFGGGMCIIGLKSDGGVVAAGGGNSNALEITGWTDIVQVVADYDNVRGLRSDGTVITSGNPHLGDCNTSGWTDIVAPISLDYCFRSDGTVVHARDEIQALLEGWTDMKLPQTAQNPFAPGGFSYDAPTEKMDYAADYQEAERLLAAGDTAGAAMAFGKLGDYEDARQRSFSLWENIVVRDTLSVGNFHTLALKTDGTVYAAGEHIGTWNTMTQRGEGSYGTVRNADSWTDIMEISTSASDSAGLKTDGTVVSAIKDGWGSTGDWKDIVSISYDGFLMGLKTDGTVAISGGFAYQSLVCDWTEIVAIEAGGTHAVGLKADGTVVAVGRNNHGECDVEDWTDIVKISAGPNLTLGLKSDGTVVAAGLNDHGQTKVEHWTDIRDISTSGTLAIGVKADGSVVAEGRIMGWYDPRSWTDIVAVAAGENHLVGLKSDGSLISIGNSRFGQCDFNGWTDLKLP